MSAALFEKAKAFVDGSTGGKMDNNTKLQFYSYYKQATVGDAPETGPGMLNFEAKAKHKAWRQNVGMSADDAKAKYVELLTKEVPTWQQ